MVKTRQDFNLIQIMRIKELKELIKDLPDDMLVGVTDHYGDFIPVEVSDFSEQEIKLGAGQQMVVFIIPVVDIGEYPD